MANLELDSYFQSWQRPTRPRTLMKVLARIAFVLAARIVVGGVLGLIAGLALTGERDSVGYLLLATPLTVVGIVLSTLHEAPGRRLGHARKILRKRLPRALAWETYEHTGDPLGDTRFPRHGRVEAAGKPKGRHHWRITPEPAEDRGCGQGRNPPESRGRNPSAYNPRSHEEVRPVDGPLRRR